MNFSSKIISILPIGMCILIDVPENGYDCSTTEDNPNCVYCQPTGRFLTGETMNNIGTGHLMSLFIAALIVIIGTCSVFTGYLIITVLHRLNSGRAFDMLLGVLAVIDILVCVSAIVTAVAMVIYLQNWSRNVITLSIYYIGFEILLISASASSFITVLIAFERYLVLAFPLKTRSWFTLKKTKIFASLVCLWSCLLGVPRFAGIYVGANTIGKGLKSVEDLEYLMYGTEFATYMYTDLYNIHDQIDAWGPLLFLTVLNALIFHRIRKIESKRKELSIMQRREINAGKMFFTVVIVLLVSTIVPIVVCFFIAVFDTVYREGMLGILLSVVVNSAANMPIYYFKALHFRNEAKCVVAEWLGKIISKKNQQNDSNTSESSL